MLNKTALVLGANAGQADLIDYLVRRGWSVTACAHKADGPGAELAHHFKLVDISDVDAVAELAKEIAADLIYSVSSDIAVPAVVEASARLGLPHYFDQRLVALLDDKTALRAHLNTHDLGVVPFRRVTEPNECADWSAFPCMVKPADSQGQRGVAKVTGPDQLQAALERAVALSPSGTGIVEAWLEGVEISYNVLVANGEVVINEVSERLIHGDHLVGVPRGHLIPPVDIDEATAAEGAALVRAVVASLGVRDGTLYFQMKATPDGPKIIEIAPRLDGCHIWRLMKHARDLDYLDLSVRHLIGEDISGLTAGRAPDGTYELMFQQAPPGTIFSSNDFPVPEGVLYHEFRYDDGEQVRPINGRMEVVGYYVRRRSS